MDASTIASMLRDPREIEPLVQLILFHAETLQLLERSNEAGELAAKGLALTSQWGPHEGEAAREVDAKLRALIGLRSLLCWVSNAESNLRTTSSKEPRIESFTLLHCSLIFGPVITLNQSDDSSQGCELSPQWNAWALNELQPRNVAGVRIQNALIPKAL